MHERIVAVGLLTQRDLNLLGPTFDRVWPVEEAPDFNELLRAIDEADARICSELARGAGARLAGQKRSSSRSTVSSAVFCLPPSDPSRCARAPSRTSSIC